MNHLRLGVADNYDRYREFWGGNPSEVCSHWLDMVLMSGGATIIAWYVSIEAFFRRSDRDFRRLSYGCTVLLLVLNGMVALVLDGKHGEGTVILVYPLFFIPILASSYYLLRRCAALLLWRPPAVIPLCLSFVVLHAAAQFHYEPSETGGPSMAIIPYWLASVSPALGWGFVRSIRTGLFVRTCKRFYLVGRKPIVWGSTILILLAVTVYADRVRKPRQTMVFNWLKELETRLTDAFVEDIKRDHAFSKADKDSRIPISRAAHALLSDERIKGDNALRIFVPLTENDYIFLWGNDRFKYCDIRPLAREHTEQIDQGFIDALIASDGTHQTRLYSALWSPYMAGRVLKDHAGKVKAICVINAP
ncbi:MAG: hypothetical protein ACXW3Z_12615 [Limisphaerales bacterium]